MRRREIPPAEISLGALRELGVDDAPTEGPDELALQGLLDMALYVAEHKKRISFPGFSWSDPCFVATDARAKLRFAYAELAVDARTTLEANLERARDGRTLLALDARRARATEFSLGHALYGEPTLFRFPAKPAEPADPRIDHARERGWTPTLKLHNLLPGRGIVVLDEHQGLFLREARYDGVVGVLALFGTGQTELWWNPFVRADLNDAELQYWKTWGEGTGPASAWREQFLVEPD